MVTIVQTQKGANADVVYTITIGGSVYVVSRSNLVQDLLNFVVAVTDSSAIVGFTLKDHNGILAENWDTRRLYAADGTTIILDWNSTELFGTGGVSVNWDLRTLTDIHTVTAVDWGARMLTDDGGNPSVDWVNHTLSIFTSGAPAIVLDWNNGELLDVNGVLAVDWSTSRQLCDNTGVQALDWRNRTLSGSDGTVLLNWNSNTAVVLTTGVKFKRTAPGAYPYTVLGTDYYVGVDATASARSIVLPASVPGQTFIISDELGQSAAHNITVTVSGAGTIDGAASKIIGTNYGTLTVMAISSTAYKIV